MRYVYEAEGAQIVAALDVNELIGEGHRRGDGRGANRVVIRDAKQADEVLGMVCAPTPASSPP